MSFLRHIGKRYDSLLYKNTDNESYRQKILISPSEGLSLASCSPAGLASVLTFNGQCKPILGLRRLVNLFQDYR
jgi:hypothetical protein